MLTFWPRACYAEQVHFFISYNQHWWHLGIQTNYITNTTEVGRILSGLFARWLIDKQEGSMGELFCFDWCVDNARRRDQKQLNPCKYINDNMIFKSVCVKGKSSWRRGSVFPLCMERWPKSLPMLTMVSRTRLGRFCTRCHGAGSGFHIGRMRLGGLGEERVIKSVFSLRTLDDFEIFKNKEVCLSNHADFWSLDWNYSPELGKDNEHIRWGGKIQMVLQSSFQNGENSWSGPWLTIFPNT